MRGDLSARTDTDLYVVTNDGSDKVLMRIPRAGGASVRVESAGSISDLVPAGDLLYFLRVNNGTATLMRRNTDSTRSEVYTFPLGSSVSALSYYGGNLYALIDNQLNVIYPATGQCTLLSGTAMLDYVIVGDTVYYISGSDMMPYQTASLLGNGSLTAEGGCLYRMNMSTGESSLVIKAGIEDLRYCDGALYFHNLSDNYVMGDASREWMEGKLYRYDLESEQNLRMLDSYDWGFYPMEGGVAIYTDGDLSYYNALGGRERTMYEPEAYAVLSGGGDAVIIYEPTNETITYAFADGATASVNAGEPGYVGPATTATPEELNNGESGEGEEDGSNEDRPRTTASPPAAQTGTSRPSPPQAAAPVPAPVPAPVRAAVPPPAAPVRTFPPLRKKTAKPPARHNRGGPFAVPAKGPPVFEVPHGAAGKDCSCWRSSFRKAPAAR